MAHIDNEKSGFIESLGKREERVEGVGASEHDAAERNVPNPIANVPPTSNTSPGPTPSTVQPKKFSSVNINKKFLEKNSGSTPSTSQSSSTTVKSGTANPKPVLQPAVSLSRLVTTKLTAVLPTSTLTGPGWSRPTSVTPVASTSNSPPGGTPSGSVSSAPQLPHVGKVIQPQPRGSSVGKKDGVAPNQPVWGRVKGSGNSLNTDVQNDFPTAAEVAQVRSARMVEKQEAAQSAAAQRQAQRAEADAFRGVHLDPNAHHWDEMEEDDDNFLGEVIDFGDGRQYTVQPVKSTQEGPPDSKQGQQPRPPEPPATTAPVRKEDRFADDFDRSWPRSRQPPPREAPPHAPPPSAPAQPSHSPQDSSRVLFNERSNRLEPYSARQNSFPARRGSRSDMPSPTDLRGGREFPLHAQSQQNVQLLQKSGEGTSQRPRKFGSSESPVLDNEGTRERNSWREGLSPSSPIHSGRPPSQMSHQEHGRRWSRDYNEETGRRGSISSARAPSRDRGREPPPHMSSMPPPLSPSVSRSPLLSRDDKLPHAVPASPSLSAHSLSSSVAHVAKPLISPVIDEETRQAAMHNAAERARIRRQQEEEERENQKERARKKAAELEAKDQAGKAEKEAKLEEERKIREAEELATKALKPNDVEIPEPPPTKPAWGRPPSLRGAPRDNLGPTRPPPSRRRSSNAAYVDPSPAAQTESWRTKAAPLPSAPPSEVVLSKPPPLVEEVDTLTLQEGEDVDIIDFSDFGKFVGAPEPVEEELLEHPSVTRWSERPQGAEGSEFQEGRHRESPNLSKTEAISSWRRKAEDTGFSSQSAPIDLTIKVEEESSMPSTRSKVEANATSQFNAQRSPRANGFREASMSALDDAMSRIKGALDHMHEMPKESKRDQSKEPTPTPPSPMPHTIPAAPKPETQRPSKWLPPALRPRDQVSNPFGLEREDPTTIHPPQSPKPVWNNFSVHLPKESKAVGALPKRQLQLARAPPGQVRWDILSWYPPVEGMNKRDFSLNEVLFRRPITKGNKARPRVALPGKAQTSPLDNATPKVNIPNRPPFLKVPSSGAFGKSRTAGETSSWRRSEPEKQTVEVDEVLDTVSRSPPPVPQPNLVTTASPAGAEVQLSSMSDGASSARSRNQPKMPAGSDIGFYRAPLQDKVAVEVGGVSFTVSSELDSTTGTSSPRNSRQNGYDSSISGSTQGKLESASSNTSPEHVPITPPHQPMNATWTKSPLTYPIKETTVRAPDPEHLKIVWSKSETKDEMPSINSLEGIADDFTTVPFTLQDVKSEDGETPPHTAPSRMSLSEVTRAFQQVPSRPSSTHPPRLPTSLPSPALSNRQPSYGLQPPAQQNNMRPAYSGGPAYHHSPVMSHSPAPVMYAPNMASPAPGRMMVSGHSPHYGQPVWMPGPAGQSPGSMMRPLHSPFPAQVMTYPSPGPSMYPPPMTNGHNHMPHHQPNGPQQGRGRGSVPMMSPAVAPQNMIYSGSPVLMHQPLHGMPGYPQPPPGGGRGQMRNGFDNNMPSPGPPQPLPNTYTAVPSYVSRPPW